MTYPPDWRVLGPWEDDDDGFLTRAYDGALGTWRAASTASERRARWRGRIEGFMGCAIATTVGYLIAWGA